MSQVHGAWLRNVPHSTGRKWMWSARLGCACYRPHRRNAQMTAHAAHCAAYALKAAPNLKKERDWQYRRPLEHLRRVVFPSLAHD